MLTPGVFWTLRLRIRNRLPFSKRIMAPGLNSSLLSRAFHQRVPCPSMIEVSPSPSITMSLWFLFLQPIKIVLLFGAFPYSTSFNVAPLQRWSTVFDLMLSTSVLLVIWSVLPNIQVPAGITTIPPVEGTASRAFWIALVLSAEVVEAPQSLMLIVFAEVIAGNCGRATAVHPSGVFCAFCSAVIPAKVCAFANIGRAMSAASTTVLMIDFFISS